FTAKGSGWEPLWVVLSMMATLSSGAFLVNLIPQQPDSSYSDGAQLYQVLKEGPWAQVDLAFAMTTASLVTPARPRDWAINLINTAGDFIAKGQRGMLLRMFACQHYLEADCIPQALTDLKAAQKLFDGIAIAK